QRRRQCAAAATEGDEKAVTSGVDLRPVVLIEHLAHRNVVAAEEPAPGTVAHRHQAARRLDAARAAPGPHHPPRRWWLAESSPPCPHDRHSGFVAHHPNVVSRGNVEDVARHDAELAAIVQPEPQFAAEGNTQMMELTTLSPGDWSDLFIPVPARLAHDPTHDEFAEDRKSVV